MIQLLFGILVLAAIVPQLPKIGTMWTRSVSAGFSLLVGILTAVLALPVLVGLTPTINTSLWELDRFGALLLLLVAFVYFTASLVSTRYLSIELREGEIKESDQRLYATCVPLFVLAMMATLLADNIGVMWVALETTTLATTLLVSFYRNKSSIEAAWKYIVLCSTGIALGLFGVLMFAYAGSVAGLGEHELMKLSVLRESGMLSADIVRWAFVFLFVGIGTKIGFVPMHTWLPDAHSKTPSPVSGMLSGILLNVAFFMLLRMKVIVDVTLGSSEWTSQFFLVFGVLSVVVPAFILLTQRNYKRMLAYSSVEHMGLLAFAIGLGPFGILPAVIHMVGHTLAKSGLFYGAGEILLRWKTTKFSNVAGVMAVAPRTGTLFLLLILMLLAVPPSLLFTSEFLFVGYGMSTHPWLTAIVLISLTMAAVGMLRAISVMLFQKPTQDQQPHDFTPEQWSITHAVQILQLVLLVVFGLFCLTPFGLSFMSEIAFSIMPL